jgi:hypothetical protein
MSKARRVRTRTRTKPNCIVVEFKGKTVVVGLPRARANSERQRQHEEFEHGIVHLVLAAVAESYRNHTPITIRADRYALTQLGAPWDGWE